MNKIVTKIILAIVFCSIIIAVTISYINICHSSEFIDKQIDKELTYVSSDYSNEFSLIFNGVEKTVNTIASTILIDFNREKFSADDSYRREYMTKMDSMLKQIGKINNHTQGVYFSVDPNLANQVYQSWYVRG